MELRLSSRWTPRPEVALAWGSQSTRRIFKPSKARQAERLMAVVVLPTPPFWFTIPRIMPMVFQTIWKRWGAKALDTVQNSPIWGELGQGENLADWKYKQSKELRRDRVLPSWTAVAVDDGGNVVPFFG